LPAENQALSKGKRLSVAVAAYFGREKAKAISRKGGNSFDGHGEQDLYNTGTTRISP